MPTQKPVAPVSIPGLTSTTEVVAAVTELQIIEVPIEAPPQRRHILQCRLFNGCLRHSVRRERCSHRRRPAAVVPVS
jgi:hypothetical protein